MVISGTKTGVKEGNFNIKDDTGTLAADTGIKNVTTVAQSAKYSVNGIAGESESNQIGIDRFRQVKAELTGTTASGETLKIHVQPQDADSIYTKAKDFIEQYNKTVRDLQSSENRQVANMNQNFGITQVNSVERNKLSSMGITVNTDHTLSLNEDRFRTALNYSPDKVRNLFGGANDFVAKVADKAENVDLANNVNSNTDWSNQNKYYPEKFFNFYL